MPSHREMNLVIQGNAFEREKDAALVARALVEILELVRTHDPELVLGDARVIAADLNQEVRDAVCCLSQYFLH
jgi:hypothetical protein